MKSLTEYVNENRPGSGKQKNINCSTEFGELLEKYNYNFEMSTTDVDDIVTDILRQLYYSAEKEVVAKSIKEFCDEEGI